VVVLDSDEEEESMDDERNMETASIAFIHCKSSNYLFKDSELPISISEIFFSSKTHTAWRATLKGNPSKQLEIWHGSTMELTAFSILTCHYNLWYALIIIYEIKKIAEIITDYYKQERGCKSSMPDQGHIKTNLERKILG
jgi:hypothetical protein